MTQTEANTILEAVNGALVAGPNGQWNIDAERIPLLEKALVELAEDPKLIDAILFLAGLAHKLFVEHDSADAAGELMITLGRVRPQLTLLDRAEHLSS